MILTYLMLVVYALALGYLMVHWIRDSAYQQGWTDGTLARMEAREYGA